MFIKFISTICSLIVILGYIHVHCKRQLSALGEGAFCRLIQCHVSYYYNVAADNEVLKRRSSTCDLPHAM